MKQTAHIELYTFGPMVAGDFEKVRRITRSRYAPAFQDRQGELGHPTVVLGALVASNVVCESGTGAGAYVLLAVWTGKGRWDFYTFFGRGAGFVASLASVRREIAASGSRWVYLLFDDDEKVDIQTTESFDVDGLERALNDAVNTFAMFNHDWVAVAA